MSQNSVKSLVLFGAAFSLALFSAGTGLPVAEAGCSDYVFLGHDTRADAHFNGTDVSKLHSIPPVEFQRGKQDHRGDQPCRGPHCREQSPVPGAPVAPPVSSGQQHAACLLVSPATTIHPSQKLAAVQECRSRESAAMRIERPPRFVS
jgi:hypothetical protein